MPQGYANDDIAERAEISSHEVLQFPNPEADKRRLPCIIMAGYAEQNRRVIKAVDGQEYLKQEVPIAGKPLLRYVIGAALAARRVSQVYIVGNTQSIDRIIADSKYLTANRTRLFSIKQKDNLFDNFREAIDREVYSYNKARKDMGAALDDRVLILTSDTCFLTAPSIDNFVDGASQADVVMGATDGRAYQDMLDELNINIDGAKTKTAMFPIRARIVRPNNMYLVRYQKITPEMYLLFQNVYDARHVVDLSGGLKLGKIRKLLREENRIIQKYGESIGKASTVMRGRMNEYWTLGMFCLSYLIRRRNTRKAIHIPNIPRMLLRKKDMEFTVSSLLGGNVSTELHVMEDVGPMLDIDVQAMYDVLAADDFRQFKRIRDYLGQRHDF
ncbi:nucleotidyltransferase family protein, partial [archaeon]|nr:nucleotidyltransferase family protein [archaeon]